MINIRIQTLEDAAIEKVAMPEIIGKATEAIGLTACIMEDMTKAHKAGVSIVLENQDGTFTTKLITEGEMTSLVAAYNGALMRFANLREDRIAEQN